MRKHLIAVSIFALAAGPAMAGRRDGWIGRFLADWLASLF